MEETGTLFASGLEVGDFSDFSWVGTGGGSNTVEAVDDGNERTGDWCAHLSFAGSNGEGHFRLNSIGDLSEIYCRWYFKIDSAWGQNGDVFTFILSTSGFTIVGAAELHMNGSDVDLRLRDHIGWRTTSVVSAVDDNTYHYLEIHYKEDTDGTDGVLEWKFDGGSAAGWSDIDFAGQLIDSVWAGPGNSNVPTDGSEMWIDDVRYEETGWIGEYDPTPPAQDLTGTDVDQAGVGYGGTLDPGVATLVGTDVDQAGLGYDGTLDPGVAALVGTDVEQAGLGYDGVLDPGGVPMTGALVNVAGVPYDSVLGVALFREPVWNIGGWSGGHEDVDEPLPPVDADFIASAVAPNRVSLLPNFDFEGDWGATWGVNSHAEWVKYASADPQSGTYVARLTSSSSKDLRSTLQAAPIVVDPLAIYEVGITYRKISGTISNFYLALTCLRADDTLVRIEEVQYWRSSCTYLTQAASSGDTVLHVADTQGWVDTLNAAMAVHHKDNGEPIYPDNSDIGEAFMADWQNYVRLKDGDIVASATQLNCETTVGYALPKGTWIRLHRSGGYMPYPVVGNDIGTSWVTGSGRIYGVADRGDYEMERGLIGQGDQFRFGTTKFWPYVFANYGSSDETVVEVDDFYCDRLDNVEMVKLRPVVDPLSSVRHHVRYRYAKNVALGTVNLKVRLLEQSNINVPGQYATNRDAFRLTEIASWTHNDIGTTPTTALQTLSVGEANSLNYTADRAHWLEFEATS